MFILSLFLWGALWLVVVQASLPSNVHHQSPLCVRKNFPCAPDGTCNMVYFPVNSSSCSNISFGSYKSSVSHLALGSLRLNSYLYYDRTYSQTAFNITFYNISWTEMKFRIMQNGNPIKNTCRQFNRSFNSSTTFIIYDCLWSDERYEGKSFIFDYQAHFGLTSESASFQFTVPLASGLADDAPKETWPLTVYTEAMPTLLGQTILNVYWAPISEVHCYRVFVFYNTSGVETESHSKEVCGCLNDLCEFSTQMWCGKFRFGVQPLFDNAVKGFISKTQYFDLGSNTTQPIFFGIVCCSILGPILLYLLFLLRNRLIHRATRANMPKILMIYSPTTAPHLHVIEALVHYLNTHCHVFAWMDELDIPNSPSKDPFLWCAEAMQAADVICVVASPFFGRIRSSSALYRTDQLLLRLLREQYAIGGKTRYCVLVPFYTSTADIPIEAASLRKLRLPRDLNSLLRLARYRWPVPSCLDSFVSGGLADYGQHGRELADCLKAASDDLRDNKAQYMKQMEEVRNEGDSKKLHHDDELEKSATLQTLLFPPSKLQDRRNEEKLLLQEMLADYPGNLDCLNLLGEKEEPIIVASPLQVNSPIDLDVLNL